MPEIKPLSKIADRCASYARLVGKKYILQTLPDLSLPAGMRKDAFCLSDNFKPKRYNSQSERLKDFYTSKGFHFLLPREEWSDKKIMNNIDLIHQKFDELVEAKSFNADTLHKAISELLPETEDKIFVSDFTRLKVHLDYLKYPEELQDGYLKGAAAVLSSANCSFLYFKFKNFATKYGIIKLKEQVGHEFKHTLTKHMQNSETINTYRCGNLRDRKALKIFNEIFSKFENSYNGKYPITQKENTQESMLEQFGIESMEELHKSFESKINELIKEKDLGSDSHLGNNKKDWKEFYNFMRLYAKDEREAYQSSKVYREYFNDTNTPTNAELDSVLYAEMEKFFTQKRIEANKLYK